MSERIEGRNAVLEALRSGGRVTRVLIAEGVRPNPGIDEIRRLAAGAGVLVESAHRRELDRASVRGAHQGVMAEVRPFGFTPVERVVETARAAPRGLVIALDHVTDPGNLGAVARSAEAVGAAGLVVPTHRSAAITAAAHKAAAGALEHIPVAQVPNLVQALDSFKEAGFWVAGAAEDAPDVVWESPLDDHLVLVAGAEGGGLARLTREACDLLVRLPVTGHVGSLNVAQAVTALAYEWLRRGAGG